MYKTLLLVMSMLVMLTGLCYGLIARMGIRAIVTRRITKRTHSLIGRAAVRDGLWLAVLAGVLSAVCLTFSALIFFRVLAR